jgi:LGFP repeat
MKKCTVCNRTYPDDTLAFCLVDGSVLSAPYDPEQTQRIAEPRATNAAATEIFREPAPSGSRPPLQSTIHAPAPSVPPLYPADEHLGRSDPPKRNLAPWLVAGAAILLLGIVGVVMLVSRISSTVNPSRTQPSPTPTASVNRRSSVICGHTVSSAMFEKWTQLGGESGKLGCPINQETEAPASPQGSTGRWIQFAKGDGGYLIEYVRADEAGALKPMPLAGHVFEVSGCMFKLYASLGGTNSWLGFPTSDGQEIDPGARQQFEGGYIVWDRKTYVCEAHK